MQQIWMRVDFLNGPQEIGKELIGLGFRRGTKRAARIFAFDGGLVCNLFSTSEIWGNRLIDAEPHKQKLLFAGQNNTQIAAPQRATNQASESQTRTSSRFTIARHSGRKVSASDLLSFIGCSCFIFCDCRRPWSELSPPTSGRHAASSSTAM